MSSRTSTTPKCLCGHVQASHFPWSDYADGDFGAHCVPLRGKSTCRCRGFESVPPSPPCPLGVESHSWCSCVPGQIAMPV